MQPGIQKPIIRYRQLCILFALVVLAKPLFAAPPVGITASSSLDKTNGTDYSVMIQIVLGDTLAKRKDSGTGDLFPVNAPDGLITMSVLIIFEA